MGRLQVRAALSFSIDWTEPPKFPMPCSYRAIGTEFLSPGLSGWGENEAGLLAQLSELRHTWRQPFIPSPINLTTTPHPPRPGPPNAFLATLCKNPTALATLTSQCLWEDGNLVSSYLLFLLINMIWEQHKKCDFYCHQSYTCEKYLWNWVMTLIVKCASSFSLESILRNYFRWGMRLYFYYNYLYLLSYFLVLIFPLPNHGLQMSSLIPNQIRDAKKEARTRTIVKMRRFAWASSLLSVAAKENCTWKEARLTEFSDFLDLRNFNLNVLQKRG